MSSSKSEIKPTRSILLSPNSTLYCLDKTAKEILWSSDLNIKVCDAYHGQNVTGYVDARANGMGNIELYYHSFPDSPGDKINWNKTREHLEEYVTSKFKDGIRFDHSTSQFKLNHRGRQLHPLSENYCYCIQQSRYMISQQAYPSVWHIDFSTYVVSFRKNKDSTIELPVHHTCNEEDFINCCQEMGDYQFSSGNQKNISLDDVSLRYKLKRKYISIPITSTQLNGRPDVVSGEYLGFTAAIKKMKMVGQAEKQKKIVLTNLHVNMCRWFGGETNDNGEMLFAFERCPYNLNYALRQDYRKAELFNILRGVVNGVHHLHVRKLCHQNITPWTVLMSDNGVPKLCGVGRWETWNANFEDVDLVGLGYLIAYCFSKKSYRSTINTEEDYNVSDPVTDGLHLAEEWDAYHLTYNLVYGKRQGKKMALMIQGIAFITCWCP